MLKLFKYLKPYILSILVCTALLFLQANMDLALPDYMSKIVNTGVQQNGIDSAVPEALRESQMDKLMQFLDEEEKKVVLENWTLVVPGSADAENLIDKYPALSTEAVFLLGEDAITEDLEDSFSRAFMSVAAIEKMLSDPQRLPDAGFLTASGRYV